MNDTFNSRMFLSTAVLAAVAALVVGPASAQHIDEGSDGGRTSVTAPSTIQPGMIPYLSHGVGVDESQFSGTVDDLDPAIRTAIAAEAAAKAKAQASAAPGAIPYLSHGTGVDESRFSGQPSVGLTGDSAVKVDRAVAAADEAYDTWRVRTAVAARQALFTGQQQPSVGLTGDSALTRSSGTATPAAASSAGDGVDWSSFGLGAGMTALLAAGIVGVVLTTRRRGDIALP